MFGNEEKVIEKRKKAYDDFVVQFNPDRKYLTFEESELILQFFERRLADFCKTFNPPMPKTVLGTALQYFKRFYLNNSVMDYHPKEILVTAAYLSCKSEEFNVTMEQFVANIKGNKERAQDIILNHELLLMEQLKFHITVHNPWRPVEGLLIDIKTRLLPSQKIKMDVEKFRPEIESFLDNAVSMTPAALIYAPSQIALAAIIHGASKSGFNLDSYVTEFLFGVPNLNSEEEQSKRQASIHKIIEAVRNIRVMVKNIPPNIEISEVKKAFEILEKCRNQDNNPESQAYKRKIQDLLVDEDDRAAKLARLDTMPQH